MHTPTAAQPIVREFQPGDEAAFRALNEQWIVHHFAALEPKDEESLADPKATIIDPGGRIFLAILNRETVGCCALLFLASGEYEVAKMTVAESCRGAGIGRKLLETTISEARAAGAHRLYLETNRKLTSAIRLYESVGFRHLPPERIVPSEYARADVYMELLL